MCKRVQKNQEKRHILLLKKYKFKIHECSPCTATFPAVGGIVVEPTKFLGSQTKFLSLKRKPQPNNSTQASTQLVRAELDSTRTESTRMLSDTQAPLSSTEKGLVALREDYASRKPKLLSTNWGFPPPKPTNHSLPYKPNWNKKPSSLIPQKPDCQTPNSNSVLRTPIQKF